MHTQTNQVMGKSSSQDSLTLFDSFMSLVESSSSIFSLPFSWSQPTPEELVRSIYTPLDDAIAEIQRRRQDPALIARVNAFLNNDIPQHFRKTEPILYLSRYVATPNHEAVHVAEIARQKGLPLVIGQDLKGKFTPNNDLKLALGKMPVVKGYSHTADEIIEYFTIVNFQSEAGKPMNEVITKFGNKLCDFHIGLFSEIFSGVVEVGDETDWVDRNFRDNIYEQYKRMLALLCVHGIMLESITAKETHFATQVIAPAMKEVSKVIGCKPLIVEHISPLMEAERNWNSYPSAVYQTIKRRTTN